jgi:hypothetical protein
MATFQNGDIAFVGKTLAEIEEKHFFYIEDKVMQRASIGKKPIPVAPQELSSDETVENEVEVIQEETEPSRPITESIWETTPSDTSFQEIAQVYDGLGLEMSKDELDKLYNDHYIIFTPNLQLEEPREAREAPKQLKGTIEPLEDLQAVEDRVEPEELIDDYLFHNEITLSQSYWDIWRDSYSQAIAKIKPRSKSSVPILEKGSTPGVIFAVGLLSLSVFIKQAVKEILPVVDYLVKKLERPINKFADMVISLFQSRRVVVGFSKK